MRQVSERMLESMGDLLGARANAEREIERYAESGWTLSVARAWVRDDEDAWEEVAEWVANGVGRIAEELYKKRRREEATKVVG